MQAGFLWAIIYKRGGRGERERGKGEERKKTDRRGRRLNGRDMGLWRDRKQWHCTFKANSLIKGSCQSSTFGLEGARCIICSLQTVDSTSKPSARQGGAPPGDGAHHCTLALPLSLQWPLLNLRGLHPVRENPAAHHYHHREPVSNLTLIKTKSIAHYTNAIDRRELEVRLIDDRYTQTIPRTEDYYLPKLHKKTWSDILAW